MSRWMPCWWAKETLSSASAVDVRLRLGRRAVAHARRADPGSFRLRQYAKGSPWIIRLIGLLLGAVFAEWAAGVEGAGWLPDTWQYSATTASSVLSSVVGSMAALLGFVVTIGVLVVQQATGTLSPRYMRLWYRDRLQKAVLATPVRRGRLRQPHASADLPEPGSPAVGGTPGTSPPGEPFPSRNGD
ncbi:DUF2254 domain-containing protein [Streptomyces sp. NBC_01278]|uniref:DUF2254 family protein n=1 Tax=Streptomyces sp. NBC_01278 TaxID=2903809 RepID=UPI002E345618|nr:DUF2254 family protein [Streptomyces sp. NBC_01278]